MDIAIIVTTILVFTASHLAAYCLGRNSAFREAARIIDEEVANARP